MAQKKWTIMVYLAGDNNLDGAGATDLKEMKKVGSTDQMDIVAQFDRAGSKRQTKRYHLKKGTALEKDKVAELGESNTGDPKALIDFILWGAKEYPAERYMVVLWNHGAGWDDTDLYAGQRSTAGLKRHGEEIISPKESDTNVLSVGQARAFHTSPVRHSFFRTSAHKAVASVAKGDNLARAILFDDNAKDFLDNSEMKKVFETVRKSLGRKIDILGMDACLMNMAEVAYQVRGGAAFTIGSEEIEPGDGWPYDQVLAALAAKPAMSPAELSNLIVNKYVSSYAHTNELVTQSACDLSHAEGLATAISNLAKTLSAGLSDPAVKSGIMQSRSQVQTYYVSDNIDLVDFCGLLQKNVQDPKIVAASQDVVSAATGNPSAFVIQSGYKGSEMKDSHGLAVYFPTKTISPLYGNLDFTQKTGWGEFLKTYLNTIRQRP